MSEVDWNKIVVELVAARVDHLFLAAKETSSKLKSNFKSRLSTTFTDYVKTLKRRYESGKTLIYRDTPHLLSEFYEPVDLSNSERKIKKATFKQLSTVGKPILITGTGGCGKSTFLKSLLLDVIDSGQFLPVFVELRYLESNDSSVFDFIFNATKSQNLDLPSEFIEKAIRRGGFALIFDGLDELSESRAAEVGKELRNIATNIQKNFIIVTSRPGSNFISWENFVEFTIAPLTIESATSLISRLKIDQKLKKEFTLDLKNELFEKHSTFLQNPLLLSIMLLAYQDNASIPGELHNFYSLAFDALYYRHDASKGGYQRITKSNLSVDRGRALLAAFSIISLVEGKTIFDCNEARTYLQKAKDLSGIDTDVSHALDDFVTSFCILLKEGEILSYAHRSFQEYFAAAYFVLASSDKQEKLVEHLLSKVDSDLTLDLAFGMNPLLIERLIVMPFLERLCGEAKLRKKITRAAQFRLLDLLFEKVEVRKQRQIVYVNSITPENIKRHRESCYFYFIQRCYPNRFDRTIEVSISGLKEVCEYLEGKELSFAKLSRVPKIADTFVKVVNSPNWAQISLDLLEDLRQKHKEQVLSFESLFT